MEHVEAQTMRLLATARAGEMKSAAVHFEAGDVLSGRLRPYLNKVLRPSFEALASAEFNVIPPSAAIDQRFLQYILNSGQFVSFASHLNAGDRPRVDFEQIGNFELALPPLAEQRRIVAEIEKLFSNLEAAQALLCAAQKKLSLYDASTLNRAFRSGHPLCRIGDVFDVYVGSTPSRSVREYWGGGTPWVSSSEVAFCRLAVTRETISPFGLANSSVKVHPPGTVLLGMIGEGKTRGQAAILDIEAGNNQNSAAIRVSAAGYPPEYLFWFLVSEYERTRNIGSGNNQPALNKSRVEDMRFPLAPLPEQVRIAANLEQAMSVTSSLKQTVSGCLTRADRLRQAILKKASEGKLVSQDPNDEPASVLLERIRATRAQTPARRTPRKREVRA
jgi:type I restriction enzyme S subunit